MKRLAVLLLLAGMLLVPSHASAALPCPCSIWPTTAVPGTVADPDTSAAELGVKFRSDIDGYVTGVRFYKSSANTGTHVGHLWTASGTSLGAVTFTGESASGWQTATFAGPIAISANTTYVVSYFAPNGRYSVDEGAFATAGVDNAPLHALRNGVDGANGVYSYGGGFPTSTWQSSNYWVDVVFDTSAVDTTAPTVVGRTPPPGATGVPATSSVTATFSEPVTGAVITVSGTTGTTTYDPSTTTATFTPAAPLAYSSAYTVSVSGATDAAGNVMTPVSWSFTTGAQPPPPPDQGPGGPILVIKPATGFTPFLAEVLRTEGLNEFATADLSTVTATMLSGYDVVLLGRSTLTAAQVTLLTDWVTGGGRLIAFRPDPQLAGLLGLTAATGTLAEGYLRADTSQPPGQGITDQTMQFHGTADRYTLTGARAVATLYSNATTATVNPAVSLTTVGTNGGQAAAFAFDLAQSLVYTRQGNPAWDGQERDGTAPRRSDDLYFGGSGVTDWVNLAKVAVPQADEQQRLLANLIGAMNLERMPLPKFWYFPRSLKAVVVATGDDHAVGGTSGRFDQYAANSPANCAVDNWQCARYTSYVFPNAPLSRTQSASYDSRGFEVGLHVNTNCSDYTPATIAGFYTNQLATWRAKYVSVPGPVTNRTHCIAWSDWSSQASTEAANGIRLDTNYYYWPGSWLANRPGFMTGSGMPMRFSAKTGGLIDVYQAATQMTDESGQTYPFTIDTLLDRALGAEGYYGAFTANMHTDAATENESDELLTSAQERGVPLITARQLLTWTDGRNASSYSSLAWSSSAGTLSFTVNVGTGANGLTGMVPVAGPGGLTLGALTRGGTPVAYTTTTIKGVSYALFAAGPGPYVAAYVASSALPPAASSSRSAADRVSPDISDVSVSAWPDRSATVSWTTSESVTATLQVGTTPEGLSDRPVSLRGGSHTVVLTKLLPETTYYYRTRSTDPSGNVTETPLASFVTPAYGVADHTVASLRFSKPWNTTVTDDGIQLAGSAARGAQLSRVLDAGQTVTWKQLSVSSTVPAGAQLQVLVRTGNTPFPGRGWTAWSSTVGGTSRYAQYRVTLTRGSSSPVLHGVGITSDAKPLDTPTETGPR